MSYQIHIAHYSSAKHGFRVYSCETYPSERYAVQQSGWHVSSGDTLQEAMDNAQIKIRADWLGIGKPIPTIIDHGKQAKIDCAAYTFARRAG